MTTRVQRLTPSRLGDIEKENNALWVPYYLAKLRLLGINGTIIPLGDKNFEGANRTTLKTYGAINNTFTASSGLDSWTTPPSFVGPAKVPVLTFDGIVDEFDSPDDNYWTSTADGTAPNEPTLSFGAWLNPTSVNTLQSIFNKTSSHSSTGGTAWALFNNSNRVAGKLWDDSADASIGQQTGTSHMTIGSWYHFIVTYDGSKVDGGIKVYSQGVDASGGASSSGTYVALENNTDLVHIGFRPSEEFLNGKLAGAFCGPFFTHKLLSADEVKRIYQLERRAIGV